MLELNNITFHYSPQKSVFHNFTMKYENNGIYGLLGKNGTGKSTLLYLIMGMLHPETGEILFNGINTSLRTPSTLSNMFIVPEEYNIPDIRFSQFTKTLAPLYPRFSEEMLKKCLNGFELSHDVNLGTLSMGEKKKAYMCLALATNPQLLLMDEPTNGLDIPSKSQFRKVLASCMNEDQTVIISTHQVKDVELLLDYVTMIDNNRILINDKMENLFSEDETVDLEKLFNSKLNEYGKVQ
ncbi:MAG: ABC transporter ATP-binding protein [Bacteroidaceae bacterium]|nr:ABC transporter ATP-binding protein [Bacteroidaceae bacterium]